MPRRETAKGREENEVEFSRIVAFSDGVFAIAITLLVLELHVPDHLHNSKEVWEALWDERETFLAFAISFAVIGRFWIVHHRFFGEVKAFDGALLWLNLLYLGTIVLIPFSSQVLGEYGGDGAGVAVYAINLAATILVGLWMMDRAHRIGLTNADAATRREGMVRAAYIAAVFLASIPVAFVAPGFAQLMWLVLFFDPADYLARRRT
ncbi:MAG TPA: TMEM175 family protein [Solirubrobacterales bacterium]|nr:TMEM175 family protein [Solirubrobacterales bacterium]